VRGDHHVGTERRRHVNYRSWPARPGRVLAQAGAANSSVVGLDWDRVGQNERNDREGYRPEPEGALLKASPSEHSQFEPQQVRHSDPPIHTI